MNKFISIRDLAMVLLFAAFAIGASAQVTIGSTEAPNKGALLDMKSVTEAASDSVGGYTSKQGLSCPRVKLESKSQLKPMYTYLGADTPTADDARRHRGLLVYNLFDSQTEDLEEGFYYWNGSEWTPLQKGQGNAVFNMECGTGDWLVQGQYIEGKELTTANSVRLKLTVTRKGIYSILLESNNGYYFTASGIFDAPGTYTVYAQGQGTPATHGTNTLVISTPNDDTPCTGITVTVRPATGTYTFNCSQSKVKGVYKLGVELVPLTNYIELAVNVSSTGSYEISTNTVDGIYFYREGEFTATGPQIIQIWGYGTPTNTKVKTMTITGNSLSGPYSCDIKVVACFKRKTYAAIGTFDYGYTMGPGTTHSVTGSRAWEFFSEPNNFGPLEGSTVKIEGVSSSDFKLSAAHDHTQGWDDISVAGLRSLLLSEPYPDIVFLGYYNSDGWTNSDGAAKMDIVREYLEKGGVCIFNIQWATAANAMIKGIFNVQYIKQHQVLGRVFTISGNNDDPIINGPFGNVRGKYWGADVDDIATLEGLPPDQFYIYSQGASECGSGVGLGDAYVSMARHRSLNLFWCGEAAWYATVYSPQPYTSASISPFSINSSTHAPIDNYNYCLPVSNSTLFGNVLYWALYEAEYNGINKE
ncbi:MAG: hypothetical protein LBR13_01215 [Dysgonamonadaceae bacterium]|jgi:hypothetical protein|nr:hypothetical protein [Dysgonamonadaceae bacterium]